MTMLFKNREPRTRDTTPYLFTTGTTPLSIAVSAGSVVGPPVLLPTQDLVNPLRVPVEVTEIVFITSVNQAAASLTPAGTVEVSLALGAHLISTFCPVILLGIRRAAIPNEGFAAPNFGNTAQEPMETRWVLPQPVILGPNEGFSGMIRLSPNVNPVASSTVTFSMVARGRRLPQGTPVPKTRCIPYASGWFFTAAGLPAPDATFRNPFGLPLNVTALTGVSSPQGIATPIVNRMFMNAPGGLANAVIRGFVSGVPGGLLFNERAAIEEAHVLNPGERYQITFDATGGFTNPGVALIGWREE